MSRFRVARWVKPGPARLLRSTCIYPGELGCKALEIGGAIRESHQRVNPRSKSLRSYDDQFAPPCLVRTTLTSTSRFRFGAMNRRHRSGLISNPF